MCSNYVPSPSELLKGTHRGEARNFKAETYPGYDAPFYFRDREGGVIHTLGRFGLVPYWTKPEDEKKASRRTYNARSETIATKPSFRKPWERAHFCVIPAQAFYEPRYDDAGRVVRWRIERADRRPMGIAGIWEKWNGPQGPVLSFAMATVNADDHPLMKNFHAPGDERRMIVILEEGDFQPWLAATAEQAPSFMRQLPAELLTAREDPKPTRAAAAIPTISLDGGHAV